MTKFGSNTGINYFRIISCFLSFNEEWQGTEKHKTVYTGTYCPTLHF